MRGTYSWDGGSRRVWAVLYHGKKTEMFERWFAAIEFALYVFRHPNVMQDLEK